jgi:phosphoglycerate kinase
MSAFRTLDQANLAGKRVLVRLDLNVPMENGRVTDATRIERQAPTVIEISDKGGKAILLSHLGRPKGPNQKESLRPVAAEVARIIGRSVAFAEDCVGPTARAAVDQLRPGDVLCLENTRFHAGEEKNYPAFVAELAALGDVFVNDAFSAAHRAHASTEGLAHRLPAYAGRSMQAELEALSRVLETPARPLVAIVGGAKISTKLDVLNNLLAEVDQLIIGGAMANTFFVALGKPVGKSLAEHDLAPKAREIMNKAKTLGRDIVLPFDTVVAQKFEAHAASKVLEIDNVSADDMILDIGPRSVQHVLSILARAKTLVWNGPLGAFEKQPFDTATIEVAEAAAELTQTQRLTSVAGGGDTVAALNSAGLTDRFTYVSTAGGAFLEWLEGKKLPGVEALRTG